MYGLGVSMGGHVSQVLHEQRGTLAEEKMNALQ